jgi:hypothetical protein
MSDGPRFVRLSRERRIAASPIGARVKGVARRIEGPTIRRARTVPHGTVEDDRPTIDNPPKGNLPSTAPITIIEACEDLFAVTEPKCRPLIWSRVSDRHPFGHQ